VEIARKLKVAPQTVSGWLHEPESVQVLESTKQRALERLEAEQDAVAGALVDVALGRVAEASVADRVRAMVAVLDRGGNVPGQKVEHAGLTSGLPIAELEARVRARFAATQSASTAEPDGSDEPDSD
jgi:hypothetical protein